MGIRFFQQAELARDVISRDFVGQQHGGVGACVLFVDAGPARGFVNSGDRRLRQIDVHLSPSFSTEWLA